MLFFSYILLSGNKEIKILRLFTRPNIIRLYEVIYTPRDILLVIEYCKYRELFNNSIEKGRLEDDTRQIFQQVLLMLFLACWNTFLMA
jgi:5'-AMP-activated protein kinase catalytic alpha subunit